MNLFKRIANKITQWRKPNEQLSFRTTARTGAITSGPVELKTQVREQMQEIGPDAIIENNSTTVVILTGPIIKQIVVPAGGRVRVQSPVLEPVIEAKNPGASWQRETKIREWDALFIAESMIEEYARGIANDRMTPDELRRMTFPFPRRALAGVMQEIGLVAHR